MRRIPVVVLALAFAAGCAKNRSKVAKVEPKAFGAALVEVSGGKQVGVTGATLDQPLVVQVNDTQGAGVAAAAVSFHIAGEAGVEPEEGLTGPDGQLTVSVTLGAVAGRYQVVAITKDKAGKPIELQSEEIALDYQQNLGRQLNEMYCSRCHDSESTAERVSNRDNLKATPHALTDGAFLNNMSDEELANIITHGGPAHNKSAEMPPYGGTLQKSEIDAVIAFMRAVADPPYRVKGLVYARN
jgi:mono/diheme cytochrome c family protein